MKRPSSSDSDLKRLEGMWRVVRAEHNGQEFPAIGGIQFNERGDYVMMWNLHSLELGNDLLNPSVSPKTIDVVIKHDLDLMTGRPLRQGMTMRGIYEIERDVFTACYGRNWQVRPTSFSSRNDGYLYVWERVPLGTFKETVAVSRAKPDAVERKSEACVHDHFPSDFRQLCRRIRAEEPRLSASLDNGGRERIPQKFRFTPRTQMHLKTNSGILLLFPDWLLAAVD